MAKPNVISKGDLIKSAKECLVNNGIEKFTLRSVAELAGVTQGTVYYHFKTKEQLLLDIVQDICESSWSAISQQSNQYIVSQAIESAKSRCSYDSFFHKLFFTLVVSSFNNEIIRGQLGEITLSENNALTKNLLNVWSKTPIEGVSMETWGILINAIVDGLALHALIQKDFPVEKTYDELEHLFKSLTQLLDEGDK
ncbi:TetR family transcriptional regulator [Heyndrickxia shackletonii]|uniref:TetR family transcriptional regulator n=1 Tax=Heyndrickxia shackletonii TaxID=157838 RepID=A0A0Q3WXD2_9BACI|nr:TetR/AcrR family transcriptional regulator [Heyndrickxia shackletonii]KQL53923.1 TetR family transcriptional regulator [Heyndrickxia shackletonii]NEY97797.1 TetR/AcrR family transcriptional regulator [Heyndrickxia shackletonii]